MAARKAKKLAVPPKPKKLTVSEQLAALKTRVCNYFVAVRSQRPDHFGLVLQSVVDGKEGTFKVSSLLASVITAQGLGKEVRLEAVPGDKSGTLYVRMYTPVPKNGLDAVNIFVD